MRPSKRLGYRDYITYYSGKGAIHCDLDVEKNTLVLRDYRGYRFGLGKTVKPSDGDCPNAYYVDGDEKAVTFDIFAYPTNGCRAVE